MGFIPEGKPQARTFEDEVKADGGYVDIAFPPCSLLPSLARDLAAQLIAAADEAESVPRFSEGDLEAIEAVLLDRMHARCSEYSDCLGALRALRKPRT